MRKYLLYLFLLNSISALLSCQNTSPGTLKYHTLNYDTNRIAILTWDTTKYSSNTTHPLPMTQEDMVIIDSLLKDATDSFNAKISPGLYQAFNGKVSIDSFIIIPERYKYQYIPYKDVNGKRKVTIIGFSTDFKHWKNEIYQASRHYGIGMLELEVNLSEKTRENLRSGDFG